MLKLIILLKAKGSKFTIVATFINPLFVIFDNHRKIT